MAGILGYFEKKQLVEIRSWARRIQLVANGMSRVFVGSDGTVSIVKIVSLSPHVGEGSYLPSNRNSPKSERIENAPLAILISTEQF